MKRLLAIILACCLLAGPLLAPPALAAAASGPVAAPVFSDLLDHWSAGLVAAWKAQQLISGYPDGTFRPEQPVSRAELCALINRALGFVETSHAPIADVPPGAWYEADVRRAIAAGYLSPADDGAIAPEAALTRQEMAAMLALALGLPFEAAADGLEDFADRGDAGTDYVPALAEMVQRHLLQGFPDGTLRPGGQTTRAQAVTLLARAFGTMYRTAGQHGPAGEPDLLPNGATITKGGTTLRNVFVSGDLYITARSGEVRLEQVVVSGEIVVAGAAQLSLDGVRARAMIVTGSGAAADAAGDTYLPRVLIAVPAGQNSAMLTGNGFGQVIVDGSGQLVLDGRFEQVIARRGQAHLDIRGEVGSLVVMPAASGAEIGLASGVTIGELAALGAVGVTGDGVIHRAGVSASGVSIEPQPETVVVSPGYDATVAGRVIAGQVALRLEHDFSGSLEGWAGGFCDLPADYDPEMYDLEFGHADLPAELGSGKGLFIAGTNRSDDLFMFVKRALGQAQGLLPNTTYSVQIEIDLATNAPAGAVGIGGAPGEALFVKVGAAPEEPKAVPLHQGDPGSQLVLSVDKGSQNDEGRYAVQVGNAAKSSDDWDWSYELKTMSNAARPLLVTTGADGQLWIFAGTDSGFEGRSGLYYARVAITLGIMVVR